MSAAENRFRRRHGIAGRPHRPISLEGPPTEDELDSVPHSHEAADRLSLFTPEQIVAGTREARLPMSFHDVIQIRDQAEMIVAAMQAVIDRTREHRLGSIRQRIEARREVASLVEALSLFHGRTPYGYKKKKPRVDPE